MGIGTWLGRSVSLICYLHAEADRIINILWFLILLQKTSQVWNMWIFALRQQQLHVVPPKARMLRYLSICCTSIVWLVYSVFVYVAAIKGHCVSQPSAMPVVTFSFWLYSFSWCHINAYQQIYVRRAVSEWRLDRRCHRNDFRASCVISIIGLGLVVFSYQLWTAYRSWITRLGCMILGSPRCRHQFGSLYWRISPAEKILTVFSSSSSLPRDAMPHKKTYSKQYVSTLHAATTNLTVEMKCIFHSGQLSWQCCLTIATRMYMYK